MTLTALIAPVLVLAAGVAHASDSPAKAGADWGGAVSIDPPVKWITPDDYPDQALIMGEAGKVTVSFSIGVDGRVSDCHVDESSGHKNLNAVPCKILLAHARFHPALDDEGKPKATHGTMSMTFGIKP